jgi:competence protein ComEC
VNVVTIRRAYGRSGDRRWQPLPDAAVTAMAVSASLGAWSARWPASLPLSVALAAIAACAGARGAAPSGRAMVVTTVIAVSVAGLAGSVRGAHEWAGLAPRRLGPFDGVVRVVDDPKPTGSASRVIVEVEGQRFEVWVRGRASQGRVRTWRGGDLVRVDGVRVPLPPDRVARVAWQHVVGELEVTWLGDVAPGGPIARASNRVRAAIERAAATLPGDDGALFRGLVVGDDRDQPVEMVRRFRASGMSHLTAVSGQNVSFLLAAAGPLLRSLRPWSRWAATVALIAWFVALTRFEPSIVRAGAMAAISATAFVRGRERAPSRVLGLAVTALVVIDPLLVRSVGFWLSVGATAGVCVVGPRLAHAFRAAGPLAGPLGVTLGAQLGVVLPSVLVFGRLPLVSVAANLLAVPVAGFVMLYGLPAGLVAGWVPWAAPAVMAPARVGVRWAVVASGKNRARHGRPSAHR